MRASSALCTILLKRPTALKNNLGCDKLQIISVLKGTLTPEQTCVDLLSRRCEWYRYKLLSRVTGGQLSHFHQILIWLKIRLTVSSLITSSSPLISPISPGSPYHGVMRLISLTVQLIPACLHYGAVTISDRVSGFHQIRLKLLLSASVPSALPDNERSTENKMEHIFSSNAPKTLALICLYEMALWWGPLLKVFIRFLQGKGEVKKAYPRVRVSGTCLIYGITADSLRWLPVFHPSSLLSLLPELSFRGSASPQQGR